MALMMFSQKVLGRHCEEQSDEAIWLYINNFEIATLRSQ